MVRDKIIGYDNNPIKEFSIKSGEYLVTLKLSKKKKRGRPKKFDPYNRLITKLMPENSTIGDIAKAFQEEFDKVGIPIKATIVCPKK